MRGNRVCTARDLMLPWWLDGGCTLHAPCGKISPKGRVSTNRVVAGMIQVTILFAALIVYCPFNSVSNGVVWPCWFPRFPVGLLCLYAGIAAMYSRIYSTVQAWRPRLASCKLAG